MKRLALAVAVLVAGCASYIPPKEDINAIRSAVDHKEKARKLEKELRLKDLKEWADQLMVVAMNEINQATAYELAVLPEGAPKADIQKIMEKDAELRTKAMKGVLDRLERSRNLRIYDEVQELNDWIDSYLARRLQIDENLYESWEKLKEIANQVGVGKYLDAVEGKEP